MRNNRYLIGLELISKEKEETDWVNSGHIGLKSLSLKPIQPGFWTTDLG